MVQPNYNQQNQQYYDNTPQQYDPQQQQQPYYDPQQQNPYGGEAAYNQNQGYDQNQQQYYQDPNQQQQQYYQDPNAQPQQNPQSFYQGGPGDQSQAQQQIPTAQGQDPNESIYVPANDGEMELHVGEPVLQKGSISEHHVYPVVGRDSLGDIECNRRFQHFYDFRTMLLNRFPGLYIPPVPKKTTTGKKDEAVIRERRYFLDLFLKECASLKYLAMSRELQTFLRPQGDLSKLLQKDYRPKLVDTLAAYRATLPVQEDFNERDVAVFSEEVTKFTADQKNLNMHLMNFKATLKQIVPIKEQERLYYQQFSNFLERYEDGRGQASTEVGALSHVRLITGDHNSALKDKLELMTQQHANPFVHINHWVKGEVWCLEALNEAVAQKNAVDQRKRDAEKEIVSLTETINKLNANKFTFGSMFKGEAGKKEEAIAKETVRAELQKDVKLFDILKRYLTIYLATVAIPAYKKQRIEAYVRAMGRMADAEVRNAENTYDCWNNFQKTILSYNIKY